jgi:hypothetical protein
MRPKQRPLWLVLAIAAAVSAGQARLAHADQEVKGTYRLVLYAGLQEVDLLLVKVEPEGSVLTGDVVKAQAGIFGGEPTFVGGSVMGRQVKLTLKSGDGNASFEGTIGPDGKIMGAFPIRGSYYPTELAACEPDVSLSSKADQELATKLTEIIRSPDAEAKIAKLKALAESVGTKPCANLIISQLLAAQLTANANVEQISGTVATLMKSAEPYGPIWKDELKHRVLTSLKGKKAYAEFLLPMAEEAEKALTDSTPLERRAIIASTIAESAEALGKADLAAAARKKSDEIESKLDAEYHEKVPPFKPEPFAGRKEGSGDRVVLLELFTGAQCPPCVAADVAFDALIDTFKAPELITLQYHLHIPGPDPLTNNDSAARAKYYADLRGTPSTYFNGEAKSGGGGGMANAESKYQQYRDVIKPMLAGKKQAEIELKAKRESDVISIQASAKALEPKEDGKYRLRFAVIEDVVKYVGGNSLRFHHHVVRAMPGGAEGVALEGGKGDAEFTVNLAETRSEIAKYLAEFEKQRPFPNALPPVKLENLSVVAFVQDDSTKEVLHAVIVPLGGAHAAAED